MLSVRNLYAGYGNKAILNGVSLDVPASSVVTLLGANGAGKSTLLKSIVGLLTRTSGDVLLHGKPLPNKRPDEALKAGISLVPEQRELFLDMKVIDNIRLGGFLRRKKGDVEMECDRLLDVFPSLRTRANQLARSLSGGEQQMLAIARALMVRPKILLLDEPSLGLAPKIVEELFDIIRQIKASGTAILLVEQNAAMALDVADSGYVLNLGEISLSGSSDELKRSSIVKNAYL